MNDIIYHSFENISQQTRTTLSELSVTVYSHHIALLMYLTNIKQGEKYNTIEA